MIAGVGILGVPVYALARLVASSRTWQLWTQSPTEDNALNYIHFPEASDRDEDRQPRPRAIISWLWNEQYVKGSAQYALSGCLELSFEANRSPLHPNSRNDACMYFANQVGVVSREMLENSGAALVSGSGTYLNLTYMHLMQGPAPSVEANEVDGELFYGATFYCGFKG